MGYREGIQLDCVNGVTLEIEKPGKGRSFQSVSPFEHLHQRREEMQVVTKECAPVLATEGPPPGLAF